MKKYGLLPVHGSRTLSVHELVFLPGPNFKCYRLVWHLEMSQTWPTSHLIFMLLCKYKLCSLGWDGLYWSWTLNIWQKNLCADQNISWLINRHRTFWKVQTQLLHRGFQCRARKSWKSNWDYWSRWQIIEDKLECRWVLHDYSNNKAEKLLFFGNELKWWITSSAESVMIPSGESLNAFHQVQNLTNCMMWILIEMSVWLYSNICFVRTLELTLELATIPWRMYYPFEPIHTSPWCLWSCLLFQSS